MNSRYIFNSYTFISISCTRVHVHLIGEFSHGNEESNSPPKSPKSLSTAGVEGTEESTLDNGDDRIKSGRRPGQSSESPPKATILRKKNTALAEIVGDAEIVRIVDLKRATEVRMHLFNIYIFLIIDVARKSIQLSSIYFISMAKYSRPWQRRTFRQLINACNDVFAVGRWWEEQQQARQRRHSHSLPQQAVMASRAVGRQDGH